MGKARTTIPNSTTKLPVSLPKAVLKIQIVVKRRQVGLNLTYNLLSPANLVWMRQIDYVMSGIG